MYLLDTCVISEYVSKKPNTKVLAWVDALDETKVFLSVLTLGEVQRGVQKLPASKRKQRLKDWLEQDLPSRFAGRILPLGANVMLRWGEWMGSLDAAGKPMALLDSLIAATVLEYNFRLVTRNVNDFQYAGVKIDNPW